MSEQQVTVPPQLEHILLEYTIRVLVDDPKDIVSHAADYFAALRDEKDMKKSGSSEQKDISDKLGPRSTRRASVVGESYTPEVGEGDEEDAEVFPKTDEERNRIVDRMKDVFFLKSIDSDSRNDVIDAMMSRDVEKDMVIIRQGDDGDFFYVVDTGTFDAYIKDGDVDKLVQTYKDSGCFGELALLHNQPRAATVKASTDGRLWAISRQSFKKLIVKRTFENRQKYMKMLEQVPELKSLSEYEKMQVCDALVPVTLKKDEVLFNEGDEGNGMYFVEEGKVSVIKSKKKEDKEIDQVKKGRYFGEMALIERQPRAASIVAVEETRLAFLEVNAFERLLGPCMELMKRSMDSYKKNGE